MIEYFTSTDAKPQDSLYNDDMTNAWPLQKLQHIPLNPGIYMFKNSEGHLLYVGKAKNLRNRVRSYFRASANLAPDKQQMVSQIADVEYMLVDSELEALLLETTLIKKHKPPFNIRMTDDKYWQYIKVPLREDFPSVQATRSIAVDGSRYFGPYTSGVAVRETLKLIRRIFLFRNCDLHITSEGIRTKTQKKFIKFGRPCLDFHIKKCVAPCAGKISKKEYSAIIKRVCDFLEGKHERILKSLTFQMRTASADHLYERAARLRDQIRSIQKIVEKQKVISTKFTNRDIIAFSLHGKKAYINLFVVRHGKLLDKKNVVMDGATQDGEQVTHACIKQYYEQTADIPDEILVQEEVVERELLERWLLQRKEDARKKVRILFPQKGEAKRLVEICKKNAYEFMNDSFIKLTKEKENTTLALGKLASQIGLLQLPVRIECYDISNISGVDAVGSMVVFEYGKPKKSDYRRFEIKRVAGPNDFAMMREVLDRRFSRLVQSRPSQSPADKSFSRRPDLIILDGGKGQLSTITKLFAEKNIRVPVVGLAKRNEEIFLPKRSASIQLRRGSYEFHLIQRIRNEAHRFAISYFRKKHLRSLMASELDHIPSIGNKTRAKLLCTFGSVQGIKTALAASSADLTRICSSNQLRNLRAYFEGRGDNNKLYKANPT